MVARWRKYESVCSLSYLLTSIIAHIFVCLKRQRFSNTSHTCDHAAKHNEKSAKQDIQTKHDAQPAEHLQELYDQDNNNLNWNQEPHELGFTHRISVVKSVT